LNICATTVPKKSSEVLIVNNTNMVTVDNYEVDTHWQHSVYSTEHLHSDRPKHVLKGTFLFCVSIIINTERKRTLQVMSESFQELYINTSGYFVHVKIPKTYRNNHLQVYLRTCRKAKASCLLLCCKGWHEILQRCFNVDWASPVPGSVPLRV